MRRGFALAIVLWAVPAFADQNDLVLGRLTTRQTDAMGNLVQVVPQNLELRALASQLGVVLAPHMLTPADTLGFGGFQLTVDYASTTIDSRASYWRVLQSSPDPSGTGTGAHGSDVMNTIGFFARKGTWFFPAPSFEFGAGAIHLVDSHNWAGQLYTKVALHEGYHDLLIPSLAFRGAVSRVMDQRELDLTVVSLDLTASMHFGIGSTWRFDPYLGWNVLMIIPRSEVIDPTPEIDPLVPGNEDDVLFNFVFKDQDLILRHRLMLGAKFQYYVFQVTLEAQLALAGDSIDDRSGTSDPCLPNSMTTSCDAKDIAATQRTLSMSVGFDF